MPVASKTTPKGATPEVLVGVQEITGAVIYAFLMENAVAPHVFEPSACVPSMVTLAAPAFLKPVP